MIQEIATYFILLATGAWTLVKLYHTFFMKPKPKAVGKSNHSCGNCNSDCALKDVSSNLRQKEDVDLKDLKMML